MILRFRTNPFVPEIFRPLLVQFGAMVEGSGGALVVMADQSVLLAGVNSGRLMTHN